MNVGRCIPEILRTVEALQIADRTGMSTPANWTPRKSINSCIAADVWRITKKTEGDRRK